MMIILAHISTPGILFQLRNFDVPMMIMISGMSSRLSHKPNESYAMYIWKRFKRLVCPVWLFLSFYFFFQFCFLQNHSELSLGKLGLSYALVGDVGFVWIIRVFLLVSTAAPLLKIYNNRMVDHFKYFLVLTIILLIHEVLRYFSLPYIKNGAGEFISLFTHYLIPYSITFAVGLRLPSLRKKQLQAFGLSSLIMFISIALILFVVNGDWITLQDAKYPPSVYYLSYSFFVSTLLLAYSKNIEIIVNSAKINALISFVAQNSIWIYLWHIPPVKFFRAQNTNFFLEFLIVSTVCITVTYLQVWIVNNFLLKLSTNKVIRRNIRYLLTG